MKEDTQIEFDELTEQINNAFLRFEAFMYGSLSNYQYFGFKEKILRLLELGKRPENFTTANTSIIIFYWEICAQTAYDWDKGIYREDIDVHQNNGFEKDAEEQSWLSFDAIEIFSEFDVSQEDEFPHISIKQQLEKARPRSIDANNSGKTTDEHQHPRYFKGNYFLLFERLIENLNQKTQLADVSFYFRQMQQDGFIYPRIGESEFREWLNDDLGVEVENQLKTLDNCLTDIKTKHYKTTLDLHNQRPT